MKRRELITLLGGAAAWPVEALTQLEVNPVRIGFLPIGSPSNAFDRSLVEAFKEGLRAVGLVGNQEVITDVVWIIIEPEFPQAVSELLKRGAKLLVTAGSSASAAAKRHTSTVPIVFVPSVSALSKAFRIQAATRPV